ncbi:hypothetical protein [Bacillus sp. UNC437CL72CviS29]|uniref:hypothetical protein n=1 Tax=Bacillus sp. UNC437CL72CviS29 TaxID=1340430 RepID=UPI00047AD2F7|nr:hypothetical protein [Bacillus sp. UNC437CL72CviS29]
MRYMRLNVTYTFNSSDTIYKQIHHIKGETIEDLEQAHFPLVDMLAALVNIQSIKSEIINEMEYLVGLAEEEARLRFLQLETVSD